MTVGKGRANPTLKRDCAKARSPLAPRQCFMKDRVITIIIFVALAVLLDTAHYLLGDVFLWKGEPPSPDYEPTTQADYIFMLVSEVLVFITVGVVIGFRVVNSSIAGLTAIALATIYLAMEGHSGYVFYYLSSHPTAFDEFMFVAPTLAPVVFIPVSTLLTKLIYSYKFDGITDEKA